MRIIKPSKKENGSTRKNVRKAKGCDAIRRVTIHGLNNPEWVIVIVQEDDPVALIAMVDEDKELAVGRRIIDLATGDDVSTSFWDRIGPIEMNASAKNEEVIVDVNRSCGRWLLSDEDVRECQSWAVEISWVSDEKLP